MSEQERHKRHRFLCVSRDPEASACRIFMSGLDTTKVNKADIIDLFSPFGQIYDVAIHQGFIFVQPGDLQTALNAVSKLNGTPYRGGQLVVKLAKDGKKDPGVKSIGEACKFFALGHCSRGESCFYKHEKPDTGLRSGPPSHMDREPPRRDYERARPRPDFDRREPDRRDLERRDDRRPTERDDRRPPMKRPAEDYHDDYHRRPMAPVAAPYPVYDEPIRYPEVAKPQLRPAPRPAPPSMAPSVSRPSPRTPAVPRAAEPPVDLRPPFDCVVIAGDEAQRVYCEMVEKRLVEFGMLTNIQIVGGEQLLKRAVDEAARHTVPYTISVTANNMEHRSLTLNILHGVAQEHRNMPLDDAMPFLSRNFDQFVEVMKKKISVANEWTAPDHKVACLLNMLADGRRLTIVELESILCYVTGIHDKMKSVEVMSSRSSAPIHTQPDRESSRDPMRNGMRTDSMRDIGRDSMREVGRDSMRDVGRDSMRDVGRDSMRDVGRDSMRDVGRDSMRDVGRDGMRDGPRLPDPHTRQADPMDDLPMLPPPKASRFSSDTGTMQDILRQRASSRHQTTSFDSGRSDRSYQSSANGDGSSSGINFNNPAVKQALDNLMSRGGGGDGRQYNSYY